jgi:hypothetical protein
VFGHVSASQLRDGTFHEDIGCGSSTSAPDRGSAIQKAKKAAVTDARKRCLRLFHDKLGNCLRDQAFLRALREQRQRQLRERQAGGAAPSESIVVFPPQSNAVVSRVERFSAASLMRDSPPRQSPSTHPRGLGSVEPLAASAEEEDDLDALAALADFEADQAVDDAEGGPRRGRVTLEAARQIASEDVDGDGEFELDDKTLAALGDTMPFSQQRVQHSPAHGSDSDRASEEEERRRRIEQQRLLALERRRMVESKRDE